MGPGTSPTTLRPGYKTTEFWLSALVAVLSAVVPLAGNYPTVVQALGVALAVLSALGYTASRTSVKNNTIL